MKAKKIFALAFVGGVAAVVAPLLMTGASAQMRGGPPREFPMPHMPDMIEGRGRPDGAGRPADPGANGLARAEQAQWERLARVQRDKAEALAHQYPADYELDRNGALAIRGQVLAANLSDSALLAAQRAGFAVVSQDMVDGLGFSVAVLAHPQWPLTRMVDKLRDIAPDAVVEVDHVFATSGADRPFVGGLKGIPQPDHSSNWRIGMIDTGSAPLVTAGGAVRLVQQGFAPGGVVPGNHGTAVASLIARHAPDEPSDMAGTLFAADIFGGSRRGGTAELMVKALGWMARQQVPVINISMVGPYNGIVATAIAILVKRGTLIVAPVGNDGPSARLLYPASLDGVVAVTAVDSRGQLLPEASRVPRVDFAGPGIAAISMVGRAVEMRGTSFASPIIAQRLAEIMTVPDPRSARSAVRTLAARAWKPKRGKSGLGNGIIGLPPTISH